eukprot:TRINITY_DN1552_c0_g1_i2.p1 TRINITY_DN1552_c0_g1~~TRINITY_DN1552_c0_g1_i2.p1  ORF type:complete len:499 (-),score=104.02 TRINITY_DN1552_c0_g1_i2:298-1794(-)
MTKMNDLPPDSNPPAPLTPSASDMLASGTALLAAASASSPSPNPLPPPISPSPPSASLLPPPVSATFSSPSIFEASSKSPTTSIRRIIRLSPSKTKLNAAGREVTQRTCYDVNQKVAVLNYIKDNQCSQVQALEHFAPSMPGLKRQALSKWTLEESKIRRIFESSEERNSKMRKKDHVIVKRVRSLKHPLMDAALSKFALLMGNHKIPGGRAEFLRGLAEEIYDELEVPAGERLRLSTGWISKFAARHGLSARGLSREEDAETVSAEDSVARAKSESPVDIETVDDATSLELPSVKEVVAVVQAEEALKGRVQNEEGVEVGKAKVIQRVPAEEASKDKYRSEKDVAVEKEKEAQRMQAEECMKENAINEEEVGCEKEMETQNMLAIKSANDTVQLEMEAKSGEQSEFRAMQVRKVLQKKLQTEEDVEVEKKQVAQSLSPLPPPPKAVFEALMIIRRSFESTGDFPPTEVREWLDNMARKMKEKMLSKQTKINDFFRPS